MHTSHVEAVAFFADGLRALSAGDDDVVMLWDFKQRRPAGPIGKHAGDIECLAISPDGRFALSGGQDKVNCVLLRRFRLACSIKPIHPSAPRHRTSVP